MKNFIKLFTIGLCLFAFQAWAMDENGTLVFGKRSNPNKRKSIEKNMPILCKLVIDWNNIEQYIATDCKGDPNYQDDQKMTLLHHAIDDDRFDMVQFLVKKYTLDFDLKDNKKRTVLDLALEGRTFFCVEGKSDEMLVTVKRNNDLIRFLKDAKIESFYGEMKYCYLKLEEDNNEPD